MNNINKQSHHVEDIEAAQPDDIKQWLLFALESYTPAEKEKIKVALKDVFDGIYSKHHEKPFRTFKIDDANALSEYLDNLLPIFSGGVPHRESAKKQILNFIEKGKANAISAGGQPVDRILFLYNKDIRGGVGMDPDFGDAINKENDIDMWDEDGNGWIEDRIEFPGAFMDPNAGDFAKINATEDLINKRPNAIIIVITAWPRRKFERLMHQYYHSGVVKYYPETVESVRNATDAEVVKKFSYEDDWDY